MTGCGRGLHSLTEYQTEIGYDLAGGSQLKSMLSGCILEGVLAHLKLPYFQLLGVRIG